jgi:hypothetical protein
MAQETLGFMIIRRRHTRNFTVIPNGIHDDDRLSLETRGLLGFLLSRPPNWEIRHDALRRKFHISRQRLQGLLKELMAAGYLTREADQPRDENMRFTSYSYVVTDVPFTDVSSPASARRPPESDSENKKQEIKNAENKLSPKSPQPSLLATQQASRDMYTQFGRQALSNGMSPVYEHSKPYRAWEAFRGPMGMPPMDEAVINGRTRRVVWLPSVFPPCRDGGTDGENSVCR